MPHKADSSFFKSKREWSKRKDRILGSYLTAYLPKIATQGRPLLIVDGFAGPGAFGDGEPGSPLIICATVTRALGSSKGLGVAVEVVALEENGELHAELERRIGQYAFAAAEHTTFLKYLPTLIRAAENKQVFLYVDPFTVEGLDWDAMDQLFALVNKKRSIEILLNFNAPSFVRRALAALEQTVPDVDGSVEDDDVIDADYDGAPSIARLNSIVGGAWWKDTLKCGATFSEQVHQVATEYCNRHRERFAEVCYHGVKSEPHHTVPKYYLVFASRHPDALRLMNDEMAKSLCTLAEKARPSEPTLFEMRPYDMVPPADELPTLVMECADHAMRRDGLIIEVIRARSGKFQTKEIRGAIGNLLKSGQLISETGKTRINGKIRVWRASGK